MAGGRPKIFEDSEDMQRIIDLYFLTCKSHQKEDPVLLADLSDDDLLVVNEIDDVVPTISGLAYMLGMTTETFRTYGFDDKFSATVKTAKQRVEMSLEQRLAGTAVTGSIFSLKNNFGWKDKTEIEQNTSMTVVVEESDAETL